MFEKCFSVARVQSTDTGEELEVGRAAAEHMTGLVPHR